MSARGRKKRFRNDRMISGWMSWKRSGIKIRESRECKREKEGDSEKIGEVTENEMKVMDDKGGGGEVEGERCGRVQGREKEGRVQGRERRRF